MNSIKRTREMLSESTTLTQHGIDKKVASALHKEFGIAHNTAVDTVATKQLAVSIIDNGGLVVYQTKDGKWGAIGKISNWRGGSYPIVTIDDKGKKWEQVWKKGDMKAKLPAGSTFWHVKSYQASYNPEDEKAQAAKERKSWDLDKFVADTVSRGLKVRSQQLVKQGYSKLQTALKKADARTIDEAARGATFWSQNPISVALMDLSNAKELQEAATQGYKQIANDLLKALEDLYPQYVEARLYGRGRDTDRIVNIITVLSEPDEYVNNNKSLGTPEQITRAMVAQYIRNLEGKK